MPHNEHPRSGVYFDDCAPHFRFKPWHAVAILVSMAMWLAIIFTAIAIYRALNG